MTHTPLLDGGVCRRIIPGNALRDDRVCGLPVWAHDEEAPAVVDPDGSPTATTVAMLTGIRADFDLDDDEPTPEPWSSEVEEELDEPLRAVFLLSDGDQPAVYMCEQCITDLFDVRRGIASIILRDDHRHCIGCDYHDSPACTAETWCAESRS